MILGTILERLSPSEEKARPTASTGFSAEILIYISNHFQEKLTLTDVAREFGYHPAYLSRSFRETFGISFVQYLTMLRLREAVLLLRDRSKSVTECVFESGFGSMRIFYSAFGGEFGCTPKEYLAAEEKKGLS